MRWVRSNWTKRDVRSAFWIGLLAACSCWAGAALQPPATAEGGVRRSPPPQSFQSGGQMSAAVLQQIAATLQRMDARLARIEKAVEAAAAARRTAGGPANR